MRVLSIDFDYFQLATEEQFNRYPSGIDRTTEEAKQVWSETYSENRDLYDIKPNELELRKLTNILKDQNKDIPVMIANSHKNIYDFIHENVSIDEKLSIINIDTHHDFFSDNPGLDCGNWLRFITEEYKAGFIWISNRVSAEIYGFDRQNDYSKKLLPVTLDCIKNKKFDLIFLCRSDTWTPPHLDKYFSDICDLILHHFEHVDIEKGIEKPRLAKSENHAYWKNARGNNGKRHLWRCSACNYKKYNSKLIYRTDMPTICPECNAIMDREK